MIVKTAFYTGLCSVLFSANVFGADVQGARVVRGDWKTVDAAAFGLSPKAGADVNVAALQKALDGGRRVVKVSEPGTYDIDRICLIDSDTELVFGPGTRLRKAKPICVALANRAAYCGGVDSNIVVRGLSFVVNGCEREADPNGPAPGLQGHVSFFHVNDLEMRDFSCTDFLASQYCLQVVDFRGFTIDGFDIRGEKDGIHLNAGRDFVIRNGKLRTGDDGIAINAGEWPDFTPRMGSICDGLVENVHDLPGGRCNFARVITGGWVQWHRGIRLQRNDLCNVGDNVYGVTPMPLGTNEYVSTTPPAHTHGVWKSPEGINFLFLQSDGVSRVNISNVTFRNVRMDCDRSIFCGWETYEWARLIHPELPRDRYPAIDIRLERVAKSAKGPIVFGNADANVAFADCAAVDGRLLEMGWSSSRTLAPRRRVVVDGVEQVFTNGTACVKGALVAPRE